MKKTFQSDHASTRSNFRVVRCDQGLMAACFLNLVPEPAVKRSIGREASAWVCFLDFLLTSGETGWTGFGFSGVGFFDANRLWMGFAPKVDVTVIVVGSFHHFSLGSRVERLPGGPESLRSHLLDTAILLHESVLSITSHCLTLSSTHFKSVRVTYATPARRDSLTSICRRIGIS